MLCNPHTSEVPPNAEGAGNVSRLSELPGCNLKHRCCRQKLNYPAFCIFGRPIALYVQRCLAVPRVPLDVPGGPQGAKELL